MGRKMAHGVAQKGAKTGTRRGMTPRMEAMRLLAEGLTDAEVSRRVGVHAQTVRKWRRMPTVAPALDAAREERASTFADSIEEARRILRDAAPLAARAVVSALDAPKEADAIRAAATLLDRVGVPRTERVEQVETETEVAGLTAEERAQLRALLMKAAGAGSGSPGAGGSPAPATGA